MSLKTATDKKGSYIVETTICLPIFLIALVVMSSIILMYSCIEDSNFIIATELRQSASLSSESGGSLALPLKLIKRIEDEHSQVAEIGVEEFLFRSERWGQDELILLKMNMLMEARNPLDLASHADYDLSFVTRAYVGKIRPVANMTAEEFMSDNTEAVFIFPKRGEKYHVKGCGVLHAASVSGILTASLKRQYAACPLCHSSGAEIGSRVYYFPVSGEDYHLAGCSSLLRNYIEIEKITALQRGYTKCSKCG